MMIFACEFPLPAAEVDGEGGGSLPSQYNFYLFQLWKLAKRNKMVQIFLYFSIKSHEQYQKHWGNIRKKNNIESRELYHKLGNTLWEKIFLTRVIKFLRILLNQWGFFPQKLKWRYIYKLRQILTQFSRYIWFQLSLSHLLFHVFQHVLTAAMMNSWACIRCHVSTCRNRPCLWPALVLIDFSAGR